MMGRYVFYNDTAATEIYTLSLHDALPIFARRDGLPERAGADLDQRPCEPLPARRGPGRAGRDGPGRQRRRAPGDRKSTRLNSSHANISYAVFCLKKKNSLTSALPSSPSLF